MGRRAKTINNYFCEAETAQSNEPAESSLAQTIGGDYATVEGGLENRLPKRHGGSHTTHEDRRDRSSGSEAAREC